MMGCHIVPGLVHVSPPSLDLMSLSASRKMSRVVNLVVTHEGLL